MERLKKQQQQLFLDPNQRKDWEDFQVKYQFKGINFPSKSDGLKVAAIKLREA